MGLRGRPLLHSSATLLLTISDTRERKEGRATDWKDTWKQSIKEKAQAQSWFFAYQFWDLGHLKSRSLRSLGCYIGMIILPKVVVMILHLEWPTIGVHEMCVESKGTLKLQQGWGRRSSSSRNSCVKNTVWPTYVIVYSEHWKQQESPVGLKCKGRQSKLERSTFYDLFGPHCRCFHFKEVFTLLIPCVKMDIKY